MCAENRKSVSVTVNRPIKMSISQAYMYQRNKQAQTRIAHVMPALCRWRKSKILENLDRNPDNVSKSV
jgi:hypothetical protein